MIILGFFALAAVVIVVVDMMVSPPRGTRVKTPASYVRVARPRGVTLVVNPLSNRLLNLRMRYGRWN